jgi:hypothetical protein
MGSARTTGALAASDANTDAARDGTAAGGGADKDILYEMPKGSSSDLDAIYQKVTLAVAPLFALTVMMSTIDR